MKTNTHHSIIRSTVDSHWTLGKRLCLDVRELPETKEPSFTLIEEDFSTHTVSSITLFWKDYIALQMEIDAFDRTRTQ